MIKIEAYQPFKTAEEALENQQAIAANVVSPALKAFLTTHLPATKSSKKQKFALGICDPHMGQAIFTETGITASFNETVVELFRGIRLHLTKIIKSKHLLSGNQTLHYYSVVAYLPVWGIYWMILTQLFFAFRDWWWRRQEGSVGS